MREISFRAWLKDEKRMVEVLVIDFDEEQIKIFPLDYDNRLAWKVKSFDEVELMQYTGLNDKNGKKIYEGDILSWRGNKHLYACRFEKAKFLIKDKYGNCIKTTQEAINYLCIEVIGNVYENADLLEVEE